jgi:cysteine synthase
MVPTKTEQKFSHLWRVIGNTPMLEIVFRYHKEVRKVYVKCEHYNLTGSIKDRMALYILQESYRLGHIKPGDTIVEATSGNTGIAFSAIGKALGHNVIIIMPDWLSKERTDIIRSLGAEVILISKEQGGFQGSIDLSRKMAGENPGIFLPKQFENKYNAAAHEETTAKEVWKQLMNVNLKPDAFTAGVGTGGTIMGAAQFLKKKDLQIKLFPIEPLESPTLTEGHKVGKHRIQGISDEFIPPIVKLDELDDIIQVSDGDSIIMAQKIARELGLAVGISSGANFLGAVVAQNKIGSEATIATVFCDSNKKYLSTDLMREEPVKEHYQAPLIELLEYNPIHRV